MTSNQIAFATQKETGRHNLETEDIQRESNRIEMIKADNQKAYNDAMADITRRYNEKYLEMQESQGQQRLDIQKELAGIEAEKLDLDNWYKTEQTAINWSAQETNERREKEYERYNSVLESLGYSEQAIKYYDAMVRNKSAEYQKSYWDEVNRIADFNAKLTQQRIQNDYSLGLFNVENQQVVNELRSEAQAETKRHNQWMEGIGVSDSILKGIDMGLDFLKPNLFK